LIIATTNYSLPPYHGPGVFLQQVRHFGAKGAWMTAPAWAFSFQSKLGSLAWRLCLSFKTRDLRWFCSRSKSRRKSVASQKHLALRIVTNFKQQYFAKLFFSSRTICGTHTVTTYHLAPGKLIIANIIRLSSLISHLENQNWHKC